MIFDCKHHWRFLYLSPYEEARKVCSVKYKQPHQGGQITKKAAMVKRFPNTKSFAMSKFVCAFVLRSLRKEHGLLVSSVAVDREIRHATASMKERKGPIDYYVKNYCNFTLVTHGVCFHDDQGKDNNSSFLENRVVLVSDRDEEEPNIPEGRGYHSEKKFQYALLDW